MTAETIHTCSYSCDRPECIRAQRDELAARLTAETSNARGEWVLVPREPSAGMLDSAETAMIESELAYDAGEPSARSDAHGFPTMRIWQAVVGYRAMLAAAPQPPSAPVGVEGLLADLETIWHSVSDDKETNAAYQRLKSALAQQPEARVDVRGLVAKLAAHVRPTCSELWDEAQAFLAAKGKQAGKVKLSYNDLCRLSSVFNDHSELHLEQDRRINEWISERIAESLAGEQ